MKITPAQQEILNKLECQRLSSDLDNMTKVDDFTNVINDDIAQTLRNEAFGEDESNSIAYYLVNYDFTCKFMCHEVSSLQRERDEFFANFNPGPDSV